MVQEIAQATVHLAQHTHSPQTNDQQLLSADDASELWDFARDRIAEKIANLALESTPNTNVPFVQDLDHPPLTEFMEERELIIYLIQLRSLINSNLDFALHWMVCRNLISA